MAFSLFRRQNLIFALVAVLSSLFRLVSCSCGFSGNSFVVEPSDKYVKEGDYVNFTCTVRNANHLTDFIEWNVSPDIANTNFIEGYDISTDEMTSVITVHARKTFQWFSCDIHSSINRICFSSRTASLKVEYFPREEDLSCGPRNPRPLQVGDVVHTYCRVKRGNPGVDMSWRFVPEVPAVSLPLARDDLRQKMRVLSYNLPAMLQMHKKVILCEVTSEIVFPGRHLQCLIGPLLTLQSPRVLIRPNDVVIDHDKSAELTCLADGYPSIFNFSWTCLPVGAITGCDSVSETVKIGVHRSFDIVVESLVAEIKCTASNSQGRSTHSVYASLLFNPNESLDAIISTATPCPRDLEPTVSFSSDNKTNFSMGNEEITILCKVRNLTQEEQIQILWKLGDRELGQGNTNFSSLEPPSFTSLLRLKGLSRNNYNESVKCMVTVCNVTHVGSVHLSGSFDHVENDSTSRMIGLSTPHWSIITNTPRVTGELHEDFSISSISTSPHSLSISPVHRFHITSVLNHTEHLSTFHEPSILGLSSRWPLFGALGVVVMASSLVSVILIIMYRHQKKVNQINMTNLVCELSKKHPVGMDDFSSCPDQVYDVPRFELAIEPTDGISNAGNTSTQVCSMPRFSFPEESSDNRSSYASTSPASSYSVSSGIYLAPSYDDDVQSEIHQDGGEDGTFHNVYANERMIQQPTEQRNRSVNNTDAVNMYPHAQDVFEIPMPAFPPNNGNL